MIEPQPGMEIPAISRPALRYHGGKFRLAPWIIAHMPPHVCYCEPFGGSASVLLQKPPSRHEVWNDKDGDVCCFFRVLRDNPRRLARAIALTPYARAELRAAWAPAPVGDELERARRLYIRCWQARCTHARGAGAAWRYQMRENGYRVVDKWNSPRSLYELARRFKEVQIEEDDALTVIERYDMPETLFYVDPPYLAATRSRPDHGYAFEMNDEAHRTLAQTLQAISGMAIVSSYPCPLYESLYAGWRRIARHGTNQVSRRTTECLWLSPSCARRQLSLGLEDLP